MRRRRRYGPPTLIPTGPVIVTRAKALTVLLILTAVFVAAVAYMVWLNARTHKVINHVAANTARLAVVQEQQHKVTVDRRRDQKRVSLLICRKVNSSNKIFADLLRELERIPSTPATNRERANRNEILQEFAGALLRLKPQNCQKLADHKGGTP